MKTAAKYLSLYALLVITLLHTSCRKEEFEFQGTPPEQGLGPTSQVANLLARTTMNDGSGDNIIDNSSCFSLELPVTVLANGTEVTVSNSSGYDAIEAIFDESVTDTDTVVITFPVTLVFSDYSTVVANNQAEFDAHVNGCSGENEEDDDIECVDIDYPVHISLFNTNTETLETISFAEDKPLYLFIVSLTETEVANIQFPISLILTDGTEIPVSDLDELENQIETYMDACDEDDNNDFDDDDCTDCNPNQFEEVLTSCTEWNVDALLRNNQNLTNLYTDYSFNFQADGTISVSVMGVSDTFLGTWSISGTESNVQMDINVIGLDDFNGTWDLNEVAQSNSQGMVVLRMGINTLRLENGCL